MWNPFSKTYKHKCPDGSSKEVFKNIDDAFPLTTKSWKVRLKAILDFISGLRAKVDATVSKELEAVFYRITQSNSSMQMKFRAVYVAYKSDPCLPQATEKLREAIDKINQAEEELAKLELQMKSKYLPSEPGLAKTTQETTPDDINKTLENLQRITDSITAETALDPSFTTGKSTFFTLDKDKEGK